MINKTQITVLNLNTILKQLLNQYAPLKINYLTPGVALMCSQRKNGKKFICAVNFSILIKNICIIIIKFRHVICIPCGEFPDIVTLLSTIRSPITTDCGVIYRK